MSPSPRSPLDLDAPTMRSLGHTVTDLLAEHLSTLRDQPAISKHTSATDPVLPLSDAPDDGIPLDQILNTLRERVFAFHAREPHPGFMAYVPSCPTFPSMVGDWIATGFNFYAGVFPVATGPNRVEQVVLDWFRRWLGMPSGAGGLLTTGGSAANLTAIVAARHAATKGDANLIPRLAMYTSDQAHSSVSRAGWMAGVSRSLIRSVPTDSDRRMNVTALRDAIASDRNAGLIPMTVVESAGTTNTGAIDPLHEVADLCEREGIWLHADAAYGGFSILSSWGEKALSGIERADTITLDPHKWLYVPFECGCLMARDPRRLFDAYNILPDYLRDTRQNAAGGELINYADYGEQLTRYSRAMKVWFSVNYFGLDAIRSAIEENIRLAAKAEQLIRKTPGLEILSPAQMGIVCFRAKPASMKDGPELDAHNEKILAALNASGKYFISSTRLDDNYSMRICILGFRTADADVEALVRDATEINRVP